MNVPYKLDRPAYPPFPPPPTASVGAKKSRIKPPPRPIEKIPPLPPLPHIVHYPKSPVDAFGIRMAPQSTTKPKRKTILERIDGWWDLGLLEKRQTRFGKNP